MADEQKPVEGQEDAAPEVNPVEVEARAKGWKPKEEYSGDESKWVDADEFMKRSDLYHQISDVKRELKRRDKQLEAVVKFTKTQTEAAYKRGLAERQAQLDAAVDAGDKEQAREITAEIARYEKEEAPAPVDGPPPEVVEFQERNGWFDKDDTMTAYAVALAQQYAKTKPGQTLAERLEHVEEEVKKRFPEKFEKPRREIPSPVESGHPPATNAGKTKYHVSKLNAEEKLVYEQMVTRNKIMGHDEYFKSLEQIGREF